MENENFDKSSNMKSDYNLASRRSRISQRQEGTKADITLPSDRRIVPAMGQRSFIELNGGWGPWSSWSSCSLSCGYGGKHNRHRNCDNPVPIGVGKVCVGEKYQSKSCGVAELCPDSGKKFRHHFLYILDLLSLEMKL